MQVEFRPDLQARLDAMATESGSSASELVEDALVGYLDEVSQTKALLDRRFDELESGRVKAIGLDEARRIFRAKIDAQRGSPSRT